MKDQSHKNIVSALALPTGKFLRVRKVFAHIHKIYPKIKSKHCISQTVWKLSRQFGKFPDSLARFWTVLKVLCFMCRCYIIICCESNNTLVWYMSQKQFKHFWRKCREKFMHFVRKVFAQKILPTGKLGLCRPLGVSLGPFCPQTMGFGGPEPPKNDLFWPKMAIFGHR